jgi:tungstate transport system permease protein
VIFICEGIKEGITKLFSFDPEMWGIIWVSVRVSTLATIGATLFALPIAFLLWLKTFPGKRIVILGIITLMSTPTILIGLLIYSLFSRHSLLGSFSLLYTPWAMILGQFCLAFPIICGLTLTNLKTIPQNVKETALTLGTNNFQLAVFMMKEEKEIFLSSVLTGFSRVFGEVGVSMMVGGNIRWYTRNITTAIAFETAKGEFGLGIGLGLVLLLIAFSLNLLVNSLLRPSQ